MKKNIAIIMGGYSAEKEISLKSGSVVYNSLDIKKYRLYRVHILNDKWVLVDENDDEYPIDKSDFSAILNDEKIIFDVVFNAIHGTPGENGLILAYFDLLGIKHTSASFYQMAITFNKRDCLSVLKKYGIKMAESIYLNKEDVIYPEQIIDKLGLPCFVKPNKSGSSIGISKVMDKNDIIPAIRKAYKEDDEILIESFLNGTEISVGVVGYKGEVTVLPITEIVSENHFFDYQAKYEGKSQEITPARISKETEIRIRKTAKKVYEILRLEGFSRAEYILIDEHPYFLEINTVPGLTEESILPKQAKEAGISLSELFNNVLENAIN